MPLRLLTHLICLAPWHTLRHIRHVQRLTQQCPTPDLPCDTAVPYDTPATSNTWLTLWHTSNVQHLTHPLSTELQCFSCRGVLLAVVLVLSWSTRSQVGFLDGRLSLPLTCACSLCWKMKYAAKRKLEKWVYQWGGWRWWKGGRTDQNCFI